MLHPGTLEHVIDYYGEMYPADYERALKTFFAEVFAQTDGTREIDESEEVIFGEWFLFDFVLTNGETPIVHFYSHNPLKLRTEELAVFGEMTESFFDLFEVVDVDVGSGMKIRCLSRNETYDVRECLGTLQVEPGMWISGRIARIDGHFEMLSGSNFILPTSFDKKSENHFRKIFRGINPKILRDLFLNLKKTPDVPDYVTTSSTSPADAEVELVRALRAYDIEKYVPIDQIRTWCKKLDIDDDEYLAPFAILMGLAAEWEDASRETTEDVINALRTFWNSLPRKKLGGNSPDEAFALRQIQNKVPHIRNSVTEFGRWVPHYDKALKQLHAAGQEKTVLEEFRTIFQLLLEEHTATRHVFRIFANAAIACFAMGDEYGGVRLLEIASEINPHYDFAKDQMERYTFGKIDNLIIEGIARRDEHASESKHAEVTKRRGTRNTFTHLRVIASLLGNLDDTKTRITLAQTPLSKRDEREAKKAFEKEPWYAYYLFLKRFEINFNHPLEEPSEITFHRTSGIKIGRNEPCPCGSGKKYKKCHGLG